MAYAGSVNKAYLGDFLNKVSVLCAVFGNLNVGIDVARVMYQLH